MAAALILLHRWLGILCCLFFAMWFASGVVMHFVPFPALTEVARVEGLIPIDFTEVASRPEQAVLASGMRDVHRVRLLQRADGPVYILQSAAGLAALHAKDLSPAAVHTDAQAAELAASHARQRRIAGRAAFVSLANDDQWTVPGSFDRHRPLFRVALGDGARTDLYVSSITGEIVGETTRRERLWNYAGSIAHWFYLAELRRHPKLWQGFVWGLSFAAMLAVLAGGLAGILGLRMESGRLASRHSGWHAWHHWLGLACASFVFTWIFSGWLSLDNGWLFSTARPTDAEEKAIAAPPAWDSLPQTLLTARPAQAREIEWFWFDGQPYMRGRTGPRTQVLIAANATAAAAAPTPFLDDRAVTAFVRRLDPACGPAAVIDGTDPYPVAGAMPGAPVFRVTCGDAWIDIDGSDGVILERIDSSQRRYRWLYRGLHTLDFPVLTARPGLRSSLIVLLCGLGFALSLTGIVIGWRRLRTELGSAGANESNP